jgi:hypothetical protein
MRAAGVPKTPDIIRILKRSFVSPISGAQILLRSHIVNVHQMTIQAEKEAAGAIAWKSVMADTFTEYCRMIVITRER